MKTNKFLSVILILAICVPLFGMCVSAGSEGVSGEVYLFSQGRVGIVPTLVPKAGTAEWAPLPGETEQRIHIKRERVSESHDVYFDVRTRPVENIDSYIFEMDIYPQTVQTSGTLTGMTLFRTSGTDGVSTSLLSMYGLDIKTSSSGSALATLPLQEWSTVSIVADISDGVSTVYDVYVNRQLAASGLVNSAVSSPERFRVAINNSYLPAEFYFDKFRLYEGSEFRDFDSIISTAETKDDVDAILGSASVFMTNGDSVYINGSKMSYAELGYSKFAEDGTFWISTNGAMAALNLSQSELSSIEIHKDGTGYVPLVQAAELAGKYSYEDGRGWICVADTDLDLSNSIESKVASENSDVVDRFMQFDRPDGEKIYTDLVNNSYRTHPRLFITPDGIEELKNDIKTNEMKSKGAEAVLYMADRLLDTEPVEYEIPDGIRLFTSCLTVRNRLFTLTTAYMITDDASKKALYFEKIWEEVYNACVIWPDWNLEKHYLDSGKIGTGIAVAYDVCYNDFTAEQKQIIRTALCEKYLYYALSTYAGSTYKYEVARYVTNWGAVCNTSALMLCLATMDEEEPDAEYTTITKYVASEALQALEWPIGVTYPDGAWEEGLTYFEYVLEHISWAACSLRGSCATDYGILDYPGVSDMPRYAMYIQTLDNGYFNYSDGAATDSGSSTCPEVFLMARMLGDTKMNDMWYDFKYNKVGVSQYTTQAVRDFMFYMPGNTSSDHTADFPLDAVFGSVEIAVMKSGWDAGDTYFASVGGKITSHWDKGGFIFESMGERWAVELGKDNYNISGGYYGMDGSTIYRKRAEGHNTLVFNPDERPGQVFGKTAYITKSDSGPAGAYAVYDLSDVYSEDCSHAERGFYLGDGRKSLTIQDEFNLNEADSEVMWFMHTKAAISESSDGKSVTLTQNGKSVKVEFMSNLSDWSVASAAAEPLPTTPSRDGQADNTGFRKIRFSGTGTGMCYIVAKITPVNNGDDSYSISYTPLSQWNVSGSISVLNAHSLVAGKAMTVTAKRPAGCTTADIYFDDELIGSALETETLRYLIPEDTSPGEHTVSMVTAHTVSDKTYSKSVQVTVRSKDAPVDENIIDFEEFDSLASDTDGMTAAEAESSLGWFKNFTSNIDKKGAKVYVVNEDGNNYLKIQSTNSILTCNEAYFHAWACPAPDKTHTEVTSGKLILEFDAYLRKNWTTRVIANPMNESGKSLTTQMLVDQNAGGIVVGDKVYTPLKGDYNWYHFEVIYDLDNMQYYGTVSDGDFVKAAGEYIGEVTIPPTDMTVPNYGSAGIAYYRIGVGLNVNSEFRIDNIRTSRVEPELLTKAEYVTSDGEAVSASDEIACSAESLRLTVSKEYAPELAAEVTVTVNESDVRVVPSRYSPDEGAIIIPLSDLGLKMGDSFDVSVSYDAALADGTTVDEPINLSFKAGDKNANLIEVTDGIVTGAINVIAESEIRDVCIYTAIYDGNILKELYTEPAVAESGRNRIEITPRTPSCKYTRIKVFAWCNCKPLGANAEYTNQNS